MITGETEFEKLRREIDRSFAKCETFVPNSEQVQVVAVLDCLLGADVPLAIF